MELSSKSTIMAKFTLLLTIAWIALCEAHASGSALMFELPDTEKFCFSEYFNGPVKYIFEYRVVRGGNNDVDAQVKSPNGKVLYKQSKMKGDRFVFETSRGEYSFCFGNEFSTWAHKVVYFDLREEELSNLAVEAGNKRPFVKTAAETSCDGIHETLTSVVGFQRDYRLKESIGRHIAEGLNRIVSWWSVTQGCFIFLAGLGQVIMLKRFFSVKTEDICRPPA